MELSTGDMLSQGRSEIVYSKVQTVLMKNKEKEDRQRFLRITVERNAGLSPVCQQIMSIQLTDDEDPYFIYSLSLAEEDFKMLKNEQGLLVDFDHFFEHLIRLLDQCQQCDNPKFLLILTNEDNEMHVVGKQNLLQIIETTNFKHLCHLSLMIVGGSDTEIKKHMVTKIKKLQEEIIAIKTQLATTQDQLGDITKKLDIKTEACDKIYGKCLEEKNALHLKLTQELVLEKEKFAKAQVQWQKSSELEKQCIQDKYEDIVKHLESQITSLKSQLQTIMEKNSQTEFSNRELKKQLDAIDKEMKHFQREAASLKKQNAQLDTDYHEKERAVQGLRTRLAVLDQELKDKTEMFIKQQEASKILNEQKQKLEEVLMEKEGIMQRQQTSLHTISEDFIKANEILTLHQNELVSIKSKLQLSTNIAFEQEKILELKTRKISDVMELMNRSNKRIQELEEEGIKLKEALQKVEKIVDERDKRLKLNEDVIDRLNRRLNEVYTQQSGVPANRWPLKGRSAPQFMGPKSTSTPLNTINITPTFVHSSLGLPPRTAPGNRTTVQTYLPIRTSGPPQQGFGRTVNSAAASSGSLGHTGNGSNSHGEMPVTGNNTSPSENDKESEAPRVPATKETRQGFIVDDSSGKDVRSLKSGSKSGTGGGIFRNTRDNPPPLSAYFNNSRKK